MLTGSVAGYLSSRTVFVPDQEVALWPLYVCRRVVVHFFVSVLLHCDNQYAEQYHAM